jgi:uncharacterized protein
MIFIAIGILALLALIFGPQLWIRRTMARHASERADFPGTGGELARHLLDEAGLQSVKVEIVEAGDHYSPVDKAVRLTKANYQGRSVTAIAIAAHEAAHAMQDAEGYAPLRLRQKLVGYGIIIEKTGSVLLLATPVIFALTRSPIVLAFEIPILTHYVRPEDMKSARQVLRAAAFTYVASALISLIDVARWIRILRF